LERIQNDVTEWATQGAEAARAVWLAENERMMRLERMMERIQRDIAEHIEGHGEREDMILETKREVVSLLDEH
jgi:hypothetical protein